MGTQRLVRFATIAVPVALGAGGLYWLLAPNAPPAPQANVGTVRPPDAASHGRLREAVGIVGAREKRSQEAIDSYGAWAGDPGALEARKLLLGSLAREPNMALKLSNLLTAIESDPTAPEQDPMWPVVTEVLSNLWTSETAPNGMDLMFAESRPRARRALISSFALLANSDRWPGLPGDQRQKLTNYFIDMYDGIVAPQKPELERALRKVAGNDVADILLRKGLGQDDHQLESERHYEQGLAELQNVTPPTPTP